MMSTNDYHRRLDRNKYSKWKTLRQHPANKQFR